MEQTWIINRSLILIFGSFFIILLFGFSYIFFKKQQDKEIQITDNNIYDLSQEEQEKFITSKYAKKIIISLITLIIVAACSFIFIKIKDYYANKPKVLPNGVVVYDFSKQRQAKASRILYEYIKKEEAPIDDEIEIINDDGSVTVIKMKSDLSRISAFEYDLNDDGENEIIGFTSNSAYWGTAGFSLFILQKNKNINNYSNLAYILNFEPMLKFYILPNKTNEFKDIILYGSTAYNFKPMIVKNNGKVYYNSKQINMLEKYMRDFADYDVSEITG